MAVNVQQLSRQALGIGRFAREIYAMRAQNAYHGLVRGDPLSQLQLAAGRADPHAVHERMRALGPVLPTRLGNLSTTSHAVCQQVLRSRAFGVDDPAAPRPGSDMLDLSLLALNPPDHTRLRRLAAPAFTPRRMAGYEALVETAIDRLLDPVARQGRSFDLMAAFASPLPIAVITRMLGLPDEPGRLRHIGATVASALDGVRSIGHALTLYLADRDLKQTFDALLVRAAADPGDDLTSALLAQEGDQITLEELSALVGLLLLAGFETTVNAIGNGVRALLADREQWQLLVDDPSRAGAVVEEVLRYDPPVQQTARVLLTPEPVRLAGVEARRGQWVMLLLAAANRDPDVFTDPHRFDVTRPDMGEHLAFSGGIHYCLGAALARMELAAAFRALAVRFPGLRPAGPVVMRPGTVLRGPRRLPVTF
ncbi:cytochrome P450 [Nakamurella deserti]|uniref:cytochrome P450 n=1 Tax=Nakamurella deserti TaxID=2164074 RepID=UPI00197C20C7|nr:cytochrome P450 [Nakamurella deserti]